MGGFAFAAGSADAAVILNLAPGQHVVEAQASGFQKFAQTILLEVGTRGRLDPVPQIKPYEQQLWAELPDAGTERAPTL